MDPVETKDIVDATDDYLDDTDVNYRPNTKKDAGATRFKIKKIPFYKITIDTPVPDEPQEKHDPPNEKQYTKDLEAIEKQIKQHEASIASIQDKIEKEIAGNNPELTKVYDEQKALRAELNELKTKIKETEDAIGEPVNKEKALKAERDQLEKEIDYKDYEKLNGMILGLQNDLGFGQLTASEEKKKMALKEKLEAQVVKTKRYQQIRDQIKVIQSTNKPLFDKLKADKKIRAHHIQKLDENQKKIEELNKNREDNKTAINQLKEQKKSVQIEIRKLTNEYYAKEREYYDKEKKYLAYKEVMDYINEFKKYQHDLKKKEEKLKKKEEKDAKKNLKSDDVEINIVKSEETVEEVICKELITYFKSLLPKTETKVETKEGKVAVSDKIAEDLKKGNLSVFDRDAENNSQVLGVAGGNKKKDKGPKVSKREQKSNTELLLLSVGILKQIKEVNLTAPNKRDQIESFIKTIEVRQAELKELAQKAKEQAKTQEAPVETKA
jgi:hypothetical protein